MSERSLNVAPHQVERVKQALKNNGFNQRSLATELGLSRQPINNFLNGKAIDRLNFIECCEKLGLDWQEIIDKPSITENDPNFVGRGNAIATLNALATQDAKVILIQGLGGIGKTTLAEKYLKDRFKIVIKFPIAREKNDIASIKGLLETKIRELGEEPGEELIVSLERLKIKLKNEKIGILIDNLEPALNGSGQFIQEHRSYVELLRALADSSLQSLTLITSREKLNEEGIKIDLYRLSGLTLEAWKQYFDHQKITRSVEHNTLKEIRDAFDGNAEAMNVISKAIITDYNRDLESYWLDNKEDLLIEPTLNNLIKKQFERLLDIKLNDAYNLLCRLGCYRYQDVPTIPEAGLICLLWDVKENQHKKRTIKVLKERRLVEFKDGEYFLHPVIRKEAISRLRNSDNWEKSNRQAAEFWTKNVNTIETVKNALIAFEAYHHYLKIYSLEEAGNVILKERDNQWEKSEHLGRAFYRLGMLQQMMYAIEKIIYDISNPYILSCLYNILGDFCWLAGYIHQAIEYHTSSIKLSELSQKLTNKDQEITNQNTQLMQAKLNWLQLTGQFNIGLCMMDIWELYNALEYFLKVKNKEVIFNGKFDESFRYGATISMGSWLCIGLLKSSLNLTEESFSYIDYAHEQVTIHYKSWDSWSKGYSLLFLAKTYKNLDKISQSFSLYIKAIKYAESSNYSQVKAKALIGLGELYCIQQDYDTALKNHIQSIEILDKIGAKCDLAEAYFQLALTYQAMGDQPNSQTYFDKALDLWGPKQINAPKQIERVKKAWLLDSPE
jgi:tetratricopeptide (TPR) repeat protein